jgi:PHP family Zn ribbon phosphoesterase
MNVVEQAYEDAITKIKSSGVNVVDNSTWQYRLNNCKKCEFYQSFSENQNMFKCRKCGCAGYKFMIESFKCPLKKPKWK